MILFTKMITALNIREQTALWVGWNRSESNT